MLLIIIPHITCSKDNYCFMNMKSFHYDKYDLASEKTILWLIF